MLKISHGGFGLVFIAMRDFFEDFFTHSSKPMLKGSFLMHSEAITSFVFFFFFLHFLLSIRFNFLKIFLITLIFNFILYF